MGIAASVFTGAAVFLRASMRTPLTGLVPLMGFIHQDSGILVLAILAIDGAVAVTAWTERTHTETE